VEEGAEEEAEKVQSHQNCQLNYGKKSTAAGILDIKANLGTTRRTETSVVQEVIEIGMEKDRVE
jgi:hypothetical protein